MSHPQALAPQVNRIQQSVLTRAERRLLNWLCARLPRWMTPDVLTSLALVAAAAIFLGYAMSNWNPAWLWLSVVGYFAHWFGDSLDGSLARFRQIERPRYGYFIDHSCDGIATLLILGGMGLSPYVRTDIALFGLAAYLLLAINTFLTAKVMGDFPLSHLGAGPTEMRVMLIALTITMFVVGQHSSMVAGFSGFDLFLGALAAVLVVVFLVQTWRTGSKLAAHDRPRS
jgi:phosphatidylglycerophosphate synthase